MSPYMSFLCHVIARVLERAGARRALLKWRAWESWRFGERELRLLRYLVDARRAAIDIGAAEGIYAFHLRRLAKHCIAFEPNPSSVHELKQTLTGVEIHEAAVSSVEGDAILRVPIVDDIPYKGWA